MTGQNYTNLAMKQPVPITRTQIYTTSDATYDYEYICECEASKAIADDAWRVKRVRYLTGTSDIYDVCWAIGTTAGESSFGLGTPDFIFKATDLNYVHSTLSYNDA